MKPNRKTLLILLHVYVALQVKETTSISVQIISHTLPFATKLFQDSREKPSSRLVYGACDTSEMVYERNCTLVIETDAPRGSPEHLHFCDVTIGSAKTPMNNVRYIYALDNDTAVVQWTSSDRLSRFAIIHFSECRIVYPKISDESKISLDLIRAPFNGTFDVTVQDAKSGQPCPRDKWCRMLVDVNGNVLESPRHWIDENNDIIDVVRTADGKRRLIVDVSRHNRSGTYIRVCELAHDNGVVKILGEYPAGNLHPLSNKITVSSAYKRLTICALNYSNLTCGQYDHDGALRLETNFKPINFSDLHSARVFNLPDGGFVLLSVNCLSAKYLNECLFVDEDYFTITILNSTTRVLKSVKIAQLKCGDEFDLNKIHFVEGRDKKICLSYVCDHRDKDGRVSVEVNCFTKQDLSGHTKRKGTNWRIGKYR